jgi:hypothetical protein
MLFSVSILIPASESAAVGNNSLCRAVKSVSASLIADAVTIASLHNQAILHALESDYQPS